jgi:hypothetical protein
MSNASPTEPGPALPKDLGAPPSHQLTPAPAKPLAIPVKRLIVAAIIAALSDSICAFVILAPPLVWAIDIITAILLFIVLGWHWLLLPGLIIEAIPGLGVIPIWLLVVVAIAVFGTARPHLKSGAKISTGKPPR